MKFIFVSMLLLQSLVCAEEKSLPNSGVDLKEVEEQSNQQVFESVTKLKLPKNWDIFTASRSGDEYRFALLYLKEGKKKWQQFFEVNGLDGVEKQSIELAPDSFFEAFSIAGGLRRPRDFWVWSRPNQGFYLNVPKKDDRPEMRLVMEVSDIVGNPPSHQKIKMKLKRGSMGFSRVRETTGKSYALFIELGDPSSNFFRKESIHQ